ncbi:MAG TPA: hypothetical protein DCL73_08985 [Treponema sp.]|nr:hypothetical protein [Treponema sp.]
MHFLLKILNELFQSLTTDTVYALVGESGTGKSYNAKLVAERFGLNAIIDDGLLIQDDKILAGRSAKSEQTYMGAVRVALFDSKEHRDEIARKIKHYHIRRVLIIGTSEKMVTKIATRLQLPPPSKYIHIEDIATKEEIELAVKSRQIEGKHVIPVASIEVKRRYPKIFSNGIRFTFHRSNPLQVVPTDNKKDSKVVEKSIVQPEFSKKSRIAISEAALTQMSVNCIREFDSGIRVKKMIVRADSRGYRLVITLDIPSDAFASTDLPLTKRVDNLQKKIIDRIESSTGIFIEEVNIIIDKVTTE